MRFFRKTLTYLINQFIGIHALRTIFTSKSTVPSGILTLWSVYRLSPAVVNNHLGTIDFAWTFHPKEIIQPVAIGRKSIGYPNFAVGIYGTFARRHREKGISLMWFVVMNLLSHWVRVVGWIDWYSSLVHQWGNAIDILCLWRIIIRMTYVWQW